MELELCVRHTPEMGKYQQRPCNREFAVVITLTTSSRWSQQVVQKSGSWKWKFEFGFEAEGLCHQTALSDRVLTL